MKKILSLALELMLFLAACGSQTDPSGSTPSAVPGPDTPPAGSSAGSEPSDATGPAGESPAPAGDSGGILIAYFGVIETDGTDTVANASRVSNADGVVGNCQFIAQAIQRAVGGDLFAIETVQEYPGTHQPLLDFDYDELRRSARPELSGEIENLDDYSVIFIGYPIWWDEAPAMIATFLTENNFSGKRIAPLRTSSYSPIDNSLHIFRELAPGATVAEGLTANRESDVRPWVDQILFHGGNGESGTSYDSALK